MSLQTLCVLLLAPACFYRVPDLASRSELTTGGTAGGVAGGENAGAGAGAMLKEPIELASGLSSPWDLAQDADDLYFTAADGVHRCAKSGEAAWLLKVTDGSDLRHLVVDDTWVYFADAKNSRIAKVEKAGGFAQAVVPVEGPFSMATDGEALFYGSAAAGVFSVNKDGSGIRQLYQGAGGDIDSIYELVVAGDEIVFGDSAARGVFAVPKDGSSEARQLTKITRPVYGLAESNGLVYFREGDAASGVLASIALSGGERSDLLLDEPGAAGVASDAGQVFFTNDVAGVAAVRSYALDTVSVRSLALDRASVRALQVDDSAVYWTEPDSGQIMKVVR